MKIFRIVFLSMLMLACFTPANFTIANDSIVLDEGEKWEQSSTDTLSEDEIDDKTNEETQDNKKKKDKDVVKLGSTFFINLLIDLGTILIIILLIYLPNSKKPDYVFTFILFNIIIFMLTYVLNEVKISMGAAFGLFAVFSMLRYRTSGISMKDMTYLFLFIGVGLIGAIHLEYYELGIINGILIFLTFILDGNIFFKRETSKSILYDNLELIHPDLRETLVDDLKKRTGLNIHRIRIGRINLLKDAANIKVYYYENEKLTKKKKVVSDEKSKEHGAEGIG